MSFAFALPLYPRVMEKQKAHEKRGTSRTSSLPLEPGLAREELASSPRIDSTTTPDLSEQIAQLLDADGYEDALRFWNRLRGKGRDVPGWSDSFKNAAASSCEYVASRL